VDFDNFISALPITVRVASIGIIVIAAVFWFLWNPKISETIEDLAALRKYFEKNEVTGRWVINDAVDQTKNINIRAILLEIKSGLFELPGDLGVKTYSLRFYQDIWTPRALLSKRVNLALYDSAPNILIGIGLLCTFTFLAIALADVMPALGAGAQPDDIRNAIAGLLKNAAGKFLTSISGMLCSLLWTYFSKSNLEALENEIEALCVSMQRHVEDTGSEAAISAQIAILGEVLNESREQVGQLKRFETDFAVAIGKALGSQMQPAFEQLTVSITNALNALTEKVGTMNEDALKKMMIDFQSAIKEHSGKEMEAFKQTLVDIAQQIKEAAEKLEGAGGTAGDAIKEGGKQFTDALAGGAGDLRQAANFLESAMITAKATVNDMDETLERATAEGRLGLDNLNNVLMRLTTTVAEVTNLVTTIQGASSDFSSAATAAATATGNLEKVVADQNNLVNTVSEAAQTLGSSLITANQEFRTSAQTMANTTQEINSGIENYSQKLGELHVSLDESLAKAIGSLNSTISELVDGLDDFLEEVRKGDR
jgi:hypothetical protein